MKKHLLFLVLLLSIIVLACKTQCPPLTDAQKADIEKEILELTNKMNDLAEKSDVAKWSELISSAEFLGWSSEGKLYQSREIWLDSMSVWMNSRESLEIGQRKFNVTVLSADIVLVDRVSVNQAKYKNGRIERYNSAISYLFKKETTGWKVIHMNVSSQVIQ